MIQKLYQPQPDHIKILITKSYEIMNKDFGFFFTKSNLRHTLQCLFLFMGGDSLKYFQNINSTSFI